VDDDDDEESADMPTLPFTAPFFIVGVVMDMDKIDDNPDFSGELVLDTGSSYGGKIAALAKSEVYFIRPDEPAYFRREDGKVEKPNLFSPFWQARLVKTSKTDRLLALALQQDIVWIKGFTPGHMPSFGQLVADLEKVLGKYL
jgi:hypothetical protein